MTDDVTTRAKQALEGVTPGPWETSYHPSDTSYRSDTYHVITQRTGDLVAVADDEYRDYEEPHGEFGRDANFIAVAPELVRGLIAEVESLDEAVTAAYSILSLLHYRGLVPSDWNREDVKNAMNLLHIPAMKAQERL